MRQEPPPEGSEKMAQKAHSHQAASFGKREGREKKARKYEQNA